MHTNSELVQPQQIMIECKIIPNGINTSALNPFDEQDYLIGRSIIGIQAFSASDVPNSPLASKLPVIPDALFPFAFLNINRSGQPGIKAGVWYKYLPLVSLRHVYNPAVVLGSNLDMFRCDPMTMQWRDSNIAFPTSTAQATTYSVPLLVTFILPQQDENQYRMAFIKGQAPAKVHGYDF